MTAKLKLHPTPEQFQALRQTSLAYRDVLNYVSRYSFAHGKKSNQQWLQRACYDEILARFGLAAQMACNVPRKAGGYLQGLMDEDQKERAAAQARTYQETLPRAGPGSPLRLPDAHLQLPPRLQPEGRSAS